MEAVILKSSPGSRFHFGEAGMRQTETLDNTAEIIHSDVLYGAFINIIAQRFPEELTWWKERFGNGDIRFSSAFNCVEYKNKFIYLLPKPNSLNNHELIENQGKESFHKKLKKIQFISKGVWEKQILPVDWFIKNGVCHLPESRAVFLKEEFNGDCPIFKLSEKVDSQKINVETSEGEGNLYNQTDLVMLGSKEARVHWYFLLDIKALSNDKKQKAKDLIEIMVDEGLGGERSTGCGRFEAVIFEVDFNWKSYPNDGLLTSLSLIIPQKEEEKALIAYRVIERGGMYYGPEDLNKRLKMVSTLAEGAIFAQPVQGGIADLSTSERAHWRCGLSLNVPLPKAYSLKENSQ